MSTLLREVEECADWSPAVKFVTDMAAGDGGGRYVLKLRTELEEQAAALFGAPSDRERIKSVLADLAKTSSDFKHIAGKALDHLSSGIVPRLRCALLVHPEWRLISAFPLSISSV